MTYRGDEHAAEVAARIKARLEQLG